MGSIPPAWSICECGAPFYDHGRYNKDGGTVYAGCGYSDCDKFTASDGSGWPNLGHNIIDVNGPRLGELLGFPPTEAWSSIRAMMETVHRCRLIYSLGGSYDEVDTFWRLVFYYDQKGRE